MHFMCAEARGGMAKALIFFSKMVSLCSLDYSGTCSVD